MKIAFITEMGFVGKVPVTHFNMRTEFAWMHALDADHIHIHHYKEVRDYDHIFVIFPKGRVYLDACGSQLTEDQNPVSDLLIKEIVDRLKLNNKKAFLDTTKNKSDFYWMIKFVDNTNVYYEIFTKDEVSKWKTRQSKYTEVLYANYKGYSI